MEITMLKVNVVTYRLDTSNKTTLIIQKVGNVEYAMVFVVDNLAKATSTIRKIQVNTGVNNARTGTAYKLHAAVTSGKLVPFDEPDTVGVYVPRDKYERVRKRMRG